MASRKERRVKSAERRAQNAKQTTTAFVPSVDFAVPPASSLRPHASPLAPRADYDATTDRKRRQAPRSVIWNEEDHLRVTARRKLMATAQDQIRNFALAGWIVRRHTESVSRFNFTVNTNDRGLKRALEQFIYERGRTTVFDAAGNCDLQAGLTAREQAAFIDGDAGFYKLRDGSVQMIESDLIDRPNDLPPQWQDKIGKHGVQTSKTGKAMRYCLCTRDGSARKFQTAAPAAAMLMRKFCFRLNQIRGVSPLSSAINTLQDTDEAFELNRVKAKLHALFGVAILKKSPQSSSMVGGIPIQQTDTVAGEDTTTDDEGNSTTVNEVKNNFLKIDNPAVMELLTDEDIKILESATPSGEFRDYSEMMIQIALLAADLPFIFYDTKSGSFSIHRTAQMQYEKSCKPHRDNNIETLDNWTVWQFLLAAERGDSVLPRNTPLSSIRWEWIAEGTPWFNVLDEIDASLQGIAGGLVNIEAWHKAHNTDLYETIDANARAVKYARETHGLELAWGARPVTISAAPAKPQEPAHV